MLITYKYNNFLSFKDSVEFNMLAPNSRVKNRFRNNYVALKNGFDVLKDAVIVGENAGGKSNFVRSLEYFCSFFLDSKAPSAERRTINNNNVDLKCPKETNSKQEFEIEITDEFDTIYRYVLKVDYWGIVEEYLETKNEKKTSYKKVFTLRRIENDIYCADDREGCKPDKCELKGNVSYEASVPGINKNIKKMLIDGIEEKNSLGLFVTKLALIGVKPAIEFISEIKGLCPKTYTVNYDLILSLQSNPDYLNILKAKEYFEIFRMVDYSICKIDIDDEKPLVESVIYRKKRNGDVFSRKIGADSSGVREFFAWAIQIYKVIYENKVVIADEMDRVLNPILSDSVVSYINGKDHFGQFIFTSHNILHLNLKNYMKEQIYFITKDIETLESELYSLADFPDVRYETTKVYEFYMKGILGGTAIE